MKEETRQILEILTSMQEDMVVKSDIKNMATKGDLKDMATKNDLKDLETRLSAEFYTATTAMRDDIVALYDEDVELDNKIASNKIDFKSLYKNLLDRMKTVEKHIGLVPSTT